LAVRAGEGRRRLLESVAELDERLLDDYLHERPCSPEDCAGRCVRARCRARSSPFVRAAFKNKGVQRLLDAIVDFLPSPLDMPPIEATQSTPSST